MLPGKGETFGRRANKLDLRGYILPRFAYDIIFRIANWPTWWKTLDRVRKVNKR